MKHDTEKSVTRSCRFNQHDKCTGHDTVIRGNSGGGIRSVTVQCICKCHRM